MAADEPAAEEEEVQGTTGPWWTHCPRLGHHALARQADRLGLRQRAQAGESALGTEAAVVANQSNGGCRGTSCQRDGEQGSGDGSADVQAAAASATAGEEAIAAHQLSIDDVAAAAAAVTVSVGRRCFQSHQT